MPETTQTELFQIQVEGAQAKSALDQLLEAIGKVEQAVVSMGEKLDTAMKQMVEPITALTTAVDKLDASVGMLNTNLEKGAGLSLLGQQAKQAQIDVADLDRTLEQYRVGTTRGFKLPGRLGGMFQSREQMVERYMLGQFGGGGLAETVSAPSPTVAPGTTLLTERNWEALRKQLPPELLMQAQEQLGGLEAGFDRLGASADRVTATIARQDAVVQQASTTLESTGGLLGRLSRAEEQLAASVDRTTIAMRMRAAQQEQGAQGMTAPATWYGPEARPGITTRGPTEQVWGGQRWEEAESLRAVQEAMGKKIVMQALMAQGAENVTNKLKRQFDMTRSKEEILREIGRTGKMTTEMEKELGLQTEQAGKRAGQATQMFRYFGRYLLRYLLLWQGIQAVRGISRTWFAAHLEMADAVADFGWRVNATAEDVARYRDKLRDVSMMVGMPVGEIAGPLAGRATEAELLRAAEASRVFGGPTEDWLRTLKEGDATLDAYAYGLRISTLATEDYAKLIDNADEVAKEFNITQTEAIGLLSSLPAVLQTDEESVAELAEALAGLYEQNQLLMTLGVAPAVTVGAGGAPQRRAMPEVMAGISRLPIERQRQLAVAIGLTSQAQQQLFLDAVAGWSEVQQAIQDTTGATGDFEDAMAGADERLKTHVESMKTAWSGLLESFGTIDALKDIVDVVAMSFKGWGMMIEWVGDRLEGLEEKAGWLYAIGQGPFGWLRRGIGAAAEFYRGGEAERRAAAQPMPSRGYAGITPGAEEPGAAYFPPMPTLRLGEGVGIGQLAAEMERVIDEVFTRPYTTASGEVIQVTKEQIDALRKNTVILDETGEAIGLLNVYAPALAVAQENLKTEVARFNLERLRDITPEQFDVGMRTILPMWEARLGAIPGFEEERELHTFFVGEQDILRQQLATQTAMSYTLQDILDVEKDALEGMWNIPTGVTMRVPLTSLDLMRWMKGAGGGGMATDMMPAGGALESAATAQDNAAIAMQVSAGAQTQAAASMSALAQSVGASIYGGVPVEPGVAKAEAAMGEEPAYVPGTGGHGRRGRPSGRPFREVPATTAAVPTGGYAPLMANFAINLVSTLLLDKKIIAEAVQTELARQLVNTTRTTRGTGGLRP